MPICRRVVVQVGPDNATLPASESGPTESHDGHVLLTSASWAQARSKQMNYATAAPTAGVRHFPIQPSPSYDYGILKRDKLINPIPNPHPDPDVNMISFASLFIFK